MKTLEEIAKTPRVMIESTGDDGGIARVLLYSGKKIRLAAVVFSWGGGWDHVSVSMKNQCPTWEEMCEVKQMFFRPEETTWEYHPSELEYVNNHPFCLHMWRLQQPGMPMPPTWMIGSKKGQTMAKAFRQGRHELSEFKKT